MFLRELKIMKKTKMTFRKNAIYNNIYYICGVVPTTVPTMSTPVPGVGTKNTKSVPGVGTGGDGGGDTIQASVYRGFRSFVPRPLLILYRELKK